LFLLFGVDTASSSGRKARVRIHSNPKRVRSDQEFGHSRKHKVRNTRTRIRDTHVLELYSALTLGGQEGKNSRNLGFL
jgi:hypothetical protein